VECLFSIDSSPSLSIWQRERLLEHFGAAVRVVAADERSQYRNRELALQRMKARLSGALTERRVRVSTKPTRSSKERRLSDKKARATTKQLRRATDDS
jgi:ribosome-associated protein